MTRKKKSPRFVFTTTYSPTPMTQAEWEASEDLLARMVARAILADHREWFGEDAEKTD